MPPAGRNATGDQGGPAMNSAADRLITLKVKDAMTAR